MRPGATIYLLRHGETEWNAGGRFQGRLDSPLTAKGLAQARAAARRLADLAPVADALCSSPLGRAQQTVEAIRAAHAYPAVQWDWRLAEVSLGSWDGLTHVDIDACWPHHLDGASRYDWYFRAPDGESAEDAAARVRSWLWEQEGTVVAISHGLLSRIIRGIYLDLPWERALELPVDQDCIWRLADGEVSALAT
ncbi:MAG TPA: histidine phosphatase family protein [Sphingobium sp.]